MSSNNPYAPIVDKFTNTKEFSYLADIWRNSETKEYTNIPKGTIEYKKFWEDIRDKCLFGFENSIGQRITGQHFFYLNFCRILKRDKKTNRKTTDFPDFIDVDYDWFWMVQHAKLNQKNISCVKGRRQGYSYKAAAIVTHEYTFYRASRNIIGAFLSNYSEGTMDFVLDNCNFLNTYTEFKKQRNPDTKQYFKASYQVNIGGVKVWKGYMSDVECMTFKDKPTAAVGKSATWLVLDECGIFPNIIQSYGYSEPLIKNGNIYTGCCLMFGSAGSMEAGSQHFYDIFINPSQYNCLEFSDPDNENKKTGYFSSAARGRDGKCGNPKSPFFGIEMMDEDGNSNELAAIDDILFEREKAKGTSSASKLHETITQFPLSYKEAFMRSKGNIFSSTEMHEWLAKLETTPHLRDEAQAGEIIFDTEGKIKWKGDPNLRQITDFPLKPEDPRQGCITIWEHPDMDTNQIPFGLYLAGCDPYDQDQSESGSLGSIFIYKRFYRADKIYNIIVAEYTGRPDYAEEFYENSRRLCIYYNAKCLYENQLKGLKAYFEQKNCIHYLYEQPQILKDIIKNSKVSRGYGIHMTKEVKDQLELYLRQWLYEVREIDGKTLFNMHTIKSIPLLKELIAYDREINTDRVIALMCCILQTHELHKIIIDSEINKPMFDTEPFFNKRLFVKNTSGKVKYN